MNGLSLLFVRNHRKWDCVREIILNRPNKRNALTLSMWAHLRELIEECNSDKSVRVIVLRGVDASAFSAGADIAEFPNSRSNLEQARIHKSVTDGVTDSLAHVRPITISAISGYCFGGGIQIASACDFRIADNSAVFALTPIKLGFVYGLYETSLLVRLIGESHAKELLYTGKRIDAAKALSYGFLNDVLNHSNDETLFDDFVDKHIAELLEAAPSAQQAMKKMFSLLQDKKQLLNVNQQAQSLEDKAFVGWEYKEGVTAFLEKRKPTYYGD